MGDRFVKRAQRLLLVAIVMVSCVSCDQVTKVAAKAMLAGKPTSSYFGDSVRLTYAENSGGFLSLGDSLPEGFRELMFGSFTAALVAGILLVLARGTALSLVKAVALSLVAAGGIGNLIDRLSFGVVRDFLNVGIGPLRTGIFNVADVAIMVGVSALLAMALRTREEPK